MILDVPYVKQKTRWSCAVASLEMLARFHGATQFEQGEIYEKIKVLSEGYKDEWCVRNTDVAREAAIMGLAVSDEFFDFLDPKRMMKKIRLYIDDLAQPIIATQRTAMLSPFGHSRVIVGYEEDPDGGEPFVIFHDPNAFPRQGVSPGGARRKWRAGIFAGMWKQNPAVGGGEAIIVRRGSFRPT